MLGGAVMAGSTRMCPSSVVFMFEQVTVIGEGADRVGIAQIHAQPDTRINMLLLSK